MLVLVLVVPIERVQELDLFARALELVDVIYLHIHLHIFSDYLFLNVADLLVALIEEVLKLVGRFFLEISDALAGKLFQALQERGRLT